MTSELAQPADPARHRPGVLAVPLPRRLDGRGFRGPAGTRPYSHGHLCPRGLRLLHRVDLLWQRGACGESGPRVPDHLSRSRPRGAPVAPHSEQARAGLEGAAHNLHLRLHLEPLRQVGEPGHPRGPPRGRRHDSLHRAPAPRGVRHLQPDHAGRLGAGRVRPDPLGGVHPRLLRYPVRRAEPRLHQAADGAHDGGGRRIGGQARGLPGRRHLGHLGRLRRPRRHLRQHCPRPCLVEAAHARPAPDRLLLALGGHAPDLDDGRHVPATAVPRARRAESPRAGRQRARLVVPPLSAPHQSLRAAHRLRGTPRVPRVRRAGGQLHPPPAPALSKMITNDVILPMLLRRRRLEDIYLVTLYYTRAAMLAVVGLGFAWARMERGQLLLVEMGLLSFIAVSQCAPAILLGLYWRRGNRKGAAAGISAGFTLWFYTLIIPALVKEGLVPASVLADGPFGLQWLNPTALLGLSGLDVTTHGVFWSLFVNVGLFVLVSLLSEQDADDRSQAAAFVGTAGEDKHAAVAPAILSATEIEGLVHHYVGAEEAEPLVRELFRGKAPSELTVPELLELR